MLVVDIEQEDAPNDRWVGNFTSSYDTTTTTTTTATTATASTTAGRCGRAACPV